MSKRILSETTLYIVVPCYNEEEVIVSSSSKLKDKLTRLISEGKTSKESKIIFVNDGSKDRTASMLIDLCNSDSVFGLINFSKNCGHQYAILAGMLESRHNADAVITIDADLQQDIEAMDLFLEKYSEGCDVVYGVRNDRKTDGFFKKATATGYYRFMKTMGCDVLPNSADYRLMSKSALNALSEYDESNMFLRGLIPTMGFKSGIVNFDVKDREAGSSKYTFKKMMTLAMDGVTSLSIRPIRIITAIGFIMFFVSLVMIIFSFVEWILDKNIIGYSTTVISIWLVGGLVLLAQGVVGEYIGRTYLETKKRPRYIIESEIWPSDSCK